MINKVRFFDAIILLELFELLYYHFIRYISKRTLTLLHFLFFFITKPIRTFFEYTSNDQ